MFVIMIICKFEVIMLLSSFEGLKAGTQICAGCFRPSKSQFLGPQTGFEGCKFEGSVRHALMSSKITGDTLPTLCLLGMKQLRTYRKNNISITMILD
jgi:hypothetical protein